MALRRSREEVNQVSGQCQDEPAGMAQLRTASAMAQDGCLPEEEVTDTCHQLPAGLAGGEEEC